MSLRVGSLLVIDELLMTKAVAETVGASWLAENPDRDRPIGVVYLDAMGSQQFVLLDAERTRPGEIVPVNHSC